MKYDSEFTFTNHRNNNNICDYSKRAGLDYWQHVDVHIHEDFSNFRENAFRAHLKHYYQQQGTLLPNIDDNLSIDSIKMEEGEAGNDNNAQNGGSKKKHAMSNRSLEGKLKYMLEETCVCMYAYISF
jgi:hypothetical protein